MRSNLRGFLLVIALSVCGLPLASAETAAFSRTTAEGQRQLLLKVDPPSGRALLRLEIDLGKKAAKKAEVIGAPEGWSARVDGRNLILTPSATGESTSASFAFKIRIDRGQVPGKISLTAADEAGPWLSRERFTVANLPAPSLRKSTLGLLVFPPRVHPGETIRLRLLDPAAFPAGSRWTVAGVEAVPLAGGRSIEVTLPADLMPGSPLELSCSDPWGEVLLSVRGIEGVEIAAARPRHEVPRLLGATSLVVIGSSLCVCGYFPDEASWRGVKIDGRPAGKPFSASTSMLMLPIEADFAPGEHVISGDGALGFPADDRVDFTAIRIIGLLDQDKLWKKQSTDLRLTIEGSREPLDFRLINRVPHVVSLDGGNDQHASSSGGSPNVLERRVDAIEKGQSIIDYELLGIEPCPCGAAPETSERTAREEPGEEHAERQDTSSVVTKEEDLGPPPSADGPCEWTKLRFEALANAFPLPDLDELCSSTKVCIDARRKEHDEKKAKAKRAEAKKKYERAKRRAKRFNDYMNSGLSAKNVARFPDLGPHYRRVTKKNAADEAEAKRAFEQASAGAERAAKQVAAAKRACAKARTAIDAQIARLTSLLGKWENYKADLARCTDCDSLQVLLGKLREALARLKAARKRCEKGATAKEREDVEAAQKVHQQASHKAGRSAAKHGEKQRACAEQEARVRQEYRRCFEDALDGNDYVSGKRERGYGHRRSVRTGVGGEKLGPVWFASSDDALRFRRELKDCLRARENGRSTRPNTLSRRRELAKCRRAEGRARESAERDGRRARDAEAELRRAQAALEKAGQDFASWDRLEAALASWIDFLGNVQKECAQNKKRCDEVRKEGKGAVEGVTIACEPNLLRSNADRSRQRADSALSRMNALTRVGCSSGRAGAYGARRSAEAVTGKGGAASRAARALEQRDEALAKADRLLAEGRCEAAEAAYRRALRAAKNAARACEEGVRHQKAAQADAARAEREASACESLENQRAEVERERRVAAERIAAEAESRRRAAAQAAAERRAREAESCAEKFKTWVRKHLDEEKAEGVVKQLDTLAQRSIETAAAGGQGVADAAGKAVRGASTRTSVATGVASGLLNLGSSLFYSWVQSELTEAVVRIGTRVDRKYIQIDLMNARGRCGEIKKSGVTYFWLRIGRKFRVFKISSTAGFQFLGDLEAM